MEANATHADRHRGEVPGSDDPLECFRGYLQRLGDLVARHKLHATVRVARLGIHSIGSEAGVAIGPF